MSQQIEQKEQIEKNQTEQLQPPTYAIDYADKNGYLEIVKWLHENREEGCTTAAMDLAVENGHLEVVKWLHENRKEGCTIDAMDYAPFDFHVTILSLLYDN